MSLPQDLTKDLLRSIEINGVSDESEASQKHRINSHFANIIDGSSGRIRLRPSVINKFKLIHWQPNELKALSSVEIRCLYCRRVISYPAWYLRVKYAVNVFHYFVCFSSASESKPKLNCKRV